MYYKQAYRALPMMLEHGLRIEAERYNYNKQVIRNEVDAHFLAVHQYNWLEGKPMQNVKFHIHTASLSLYEPLDGDIGIDADDAVVSYHSHYKKWLEIATPHDCDVDAILPVKIMHRNGMPFYWPCSEIVETKALVDQSVAFAQIQEAIVAAVKEQIRGRKAPDDEIVSYATICTPFWNVLVNKLDVMHEASGDVLHFCNMRIKEDKAAPPDTITVRDDYGRQIGCLVLRGIV